MISTRRMVAAVALAAGASALAAPAANAAIEPISPIGTVDSLATAAIPAEHRGAIPTVSSQLGGLSRLNELHQVTDLAAPVMGFVPAVQ
ncbi:hypothetical protein [Streptomyces sp. MZ04]|uniref:hypothetical protein n=1 Tax=Streptomyces sp. MZ04 TaxID=2559236 RepID=UPI00107E6A9E|nr:hypothetical protein [Streptomyces sp. MZ04]TGA93789.1 hypothetical protein E2651_35440 [Streptomyces sp. MZ04]